MYDIKVRETMLCVREQFSGHAACPHRKGYITLIKGETGNGANVSFVTGYPFFRLPIISTFLCTQKEFMLVCFGN